MPDIVLDSENTPCYTVKLGDKEYSVDPITVVLKMQQNGVMSGDGQMVPDLGKVIDSIRDAFGIPELGDSQAIVLATAFRKYIEYLQKKMGLTPTSSPPMVPVGAHRKSA